jgi:hypothetical protein
MIDTNFISSYCIIRNNKIFLNSENVYSYENPLTYNDFIKTAFRSQQITYPKFFKMDNLSKLAFLTTELLLKNSTIKEYKENEVAVIILNSSSSLDTDMEYYETIKDKANYYPNPSLFVYTLPNIMIGEICIRNGFKGENMLLVSQQFNPELLATTINDLLQNNKAKCCITGWVEYKRNNDNTFFQDPYYDSFLCLIEKKEGAGNTNIEFNIENINNLYNNKAS